MIHKRDMSEHGQSYQLEIESIITGCANVLYVSELHWCRGHSFTYACPIRQCAALNIRLAVSEIVAPIG